MHPGFTNNICHMNHFLKSIILIGLSITVEGQVIDWNNFDERKMDTVMFNVMNSYVDYRHPGDYLVWSPVLQKEVMQSNYDFIKSRRLQEIHSLHNNKWVNPEGLPPDIKNKIIEEGINPIFLDGQKYTYEIDSEGNTAEAYGTFDYTEILVSIPAYSCDTYQELANHAIHSWNRSTEGHAGIMNANYRKKVIVGTIAFYSKGSRRVFISFVYIS